MGRIDGIRPEPTYELTIADCGKILHDCAIGDSIAVNGACLTVTEFDAKEGWFKVGLGTSSNSGSEVQLVYTVYLCSSRNS